MLPNESSIRIIDSYLLRGFFINNSNKDFTDWLTQQFPEKIFTIENLTGDAGFRHYYRLHFATHTIIAVDAPPKQSNNVAFLAIAQTLEKQRIHAPKVLCNNITKGFFCLSDLGHKLLGDIDYTNENHVFHYYQNAIDCLVSMIKITDVPDYSLPDYDDNFIQTELAIFPEWLLSKHLSLSLTKDELDSLQKCFDFLIHDILTQPAVFMHRDYHSRNIMLTPPDNDIAIIDFQDAVIGPITYDIVSLLRDCYVTLPDSVVQQLFSYFKAQLLKADVNENAHFSVVDYKQWQQWFDLMGVQRHLKASGIFARLHHRDNKSAYLNDIPQTLSYIISVTEHYPELAFLHQFIKHTVLPTVMDKAQERSFLKPVQQNETPS